MWPYRKSQHEETLFRITGKSVYWIWFPEFWSVTNLYRSYAVAQVRLRNSYLSWRYGNRRDKPHLSPYWE